MALRVENSTASIALGKESRANGWWRFRDTRSKEPENLGWAKTPFPALLFEACWFVTRVIHRWAAEWPNLVQIAIRQRVPMQTDFERTDTGEHDLSHLWPRSCENWFREGPQP